VPDEQLLSGPVWEAVFALGDEMGERREYTLGGNNVLPRPDIGVHLRPNIHNRLCIRGDMVRHRVDEPPTEERTDARCDRHITVIRAIVILSIIDEASDLCSPKLRSL